MPLPSKIREIEKREGRPIAAILQDAYQKYGKQKLVAQALGVSAPTVSIWVDRVGLVEKTIVVPKAS